MRGSLELFYKQSKVYINYIINFQFGFFFQIIILFYFLVFKTLFNCIIINNFIFYIVNLNFYKPNLYKLKQFLKLHL